MSLAQPTLASSLEDEIAKLRADVDALQRENRTMQLVKNNGTFSFFMAHRACDP